MVRKRFTRHTPALTATTALTAVLSVSLLLTGCSGNNSADLAKQWQNSNEKGYVSGDGTSLSLPPSARSQPVEFSGTTDQGTVYGSKDTLGHVTVVNFWYAGCAPCRAEAPDLAAAAKEFSDQGVKFVGVNTRDDVAQAKQFADEFAILYPSIIDANESRGTQRAFAGQIPLNAVPTTLVLDTQGRVAHRVVGQLADTSQLRTLITETLEENGS